MVTIDATDDDGLIDALFGVITNIGSATAQINSVEIDDAEHTIDDYLFYLQGDEDFNPWVSEDAPAIITVNGTNELRIGSNVFDEENLVALTYSAYPTNFNVTINYTAENSTSPEYQLKIPIRIIQSSPMLLAEFDVYAYEKNVDQTITRTAYNSGSYMSPTGGGSSTSGIQFANDQFSFSGDTILLAKNPTAKSDVEGRGTPIEFAIKIPANTRPTGSTPLVGTFKFMDDSGNEYDESQVKVVFNVHVLPAPRANLEDETITISSRDDLNKWLDNSVNGNRYAIKNSGDGVATITAISLGTNDITLGSGVSDTDLDPQLHLVGKTVVGNPSGTSFSVSDFWSGRDSDIVDGSRYEQEVLIKYKDDFTDEFGETEKTATITFIVNIGKSTTSANVTVNKNGQPWTAAGEGFSAPTRVAIANTAPSGATAGTQLVSARATIADLELSTPYNVYVYRDSTWERVGTWTSGSGDSSNCVVNYYTATVTLTGSAGGSDGSSISAISGTNSLAAGTVTDGRSLLFGTVGAATATTFGAASFTVKKGTGETITRTDIRGTTATTPNTINNVPSGSYSFTMPGSQATIEYAAAPSTYTYTLTLNKDKAAWNNATSVTMTEGSTPATVTHTPGTNTYSWTLTHGHTYTLTVSDASLASTYTESTGTITGPVNKTLDFFTVNLAVAAVSGATHGSVGFAANPTTTSASKVYPAGDTVSIYAAPDSQYAFGGWAKTGGASGVGNIASPATANTTYKIGTAAQETGAITLTASFSQSEFDASLALTLNGQAVTALTSDITAITIGGKAATYDGTDDRWEVANLAAGTHPVSVTASGRAYTAGSVSIASPNATYALYTVEVKDGAGNDTTHHPAITRIDGNNTTGSPMKVVVPAGVAVTLAANASTGYTANGHWSATVAAGAATDVGANSYTISAADAAAIDAAANTGHAGVVLTPQFTWAVTVRTVRGSNPQTVNSIQIKAADGTVAGTASNASTASATGLTLGATYEVWVNGFESSVTVSQANAGTTVDVTLYTVSTNVRYVTTGGDEIANYRTSIYTGSDTQPSATVGSTGTGTSTSVYVPTGASGNLTLTASAGTAARYTQRAAAPWTASAGTAAGTTYTMANIAADATVSANFIPSHKITIATSKRPGGAAGSASAATASITVNGDTLANGGVTYVQIANANGTSATFAVTDPTTTNTAYVTPGDWEAAAAFGGTAGAYTTAADATVTPVFALKPTLSPASRSYDIGAGASSQTLPVYTWTKNDAVQLDKIEIKKSTEADTAYATLDATNYTVSGANYTLKAAYLKTLDVGTYNLRFVSTTDGTNTDLVANLVITSTAATLERVNIQVKGNTSATHTASGNDLEYKDHTPTGIRKEDLSWQWYRYTSAPTQSKINSVNASWTAITGQTGDTYTVTDADKGYYVFAVVTASVTGTGMVVTNSIAVDYEINVKTVDSAGASIGAAASSPTAVYYTTNSGSTKTTVAYDADASAFVATGLIPGNTYNFYTNAVGGKTGTSDPFVKAADKTHTDRSDVTTTYYTVSTDDITADNDKYSSVGFTSGGSYYADGSVTGVGITAAVGSTTVPEGGYVLSGQSAVFTAANWTKDYTLTFSQKQTGTADDTKATLNRTTTGTADNQKRVSVPLAISRDTTVDGVLSMNFHNVAAHVMGSGAVTEITLTLTDDGKTYIFTTAATDAGNNKFNGVGGPVTGQMTASAQSPQTFSLPRGTYAAGSTVPATTTLNGYRKPHSTGSTAYSATLNVAAGTDASFDIGTTDTSLVLNVVDSYSGNFSSTTAVNGSASYTSGVTHDGTMARTVTVPYQYAAQTINLTLTNSNSSTGTMSGVTIGTINGNGTGNPVVSVGTAVSNRTLARGANATSSLVIAASNDVVPGTYTYTIPISFTEGGNTPTVTYTLTVVVEEGKLDTSSITKDSTAVTNGTHAEVADVLTFDNFVAQKLTATNGANYVYGATYTGGKTNFTETTDYTYQWQKSTNGGTSWSDITGATNATYTIAAGDANSDIRLLVKSVAGGKLIEEAPSPYVSVGYNAQVTVRVDGTAIANNSDGYTVVLHPNSVAANVTTGDVPLTFKSAGVFSTDDSATLVRGTTYNVVVKNGTYATAKNTTLPASYNINGTNTSRTVDYYTVKYLDEIAAAQRYEYVTGSGETFATDPAITAVVVGDGNKPIATERTVLVGENVRFSTSWDQDYSIKWMQTLNGDLITINDVEMTTALSGTKSENLTHSYNLKTNTIYATLTQKTYTVTGVVANPAGQSGGHITEATITNGTITYTTGAADAGNNVFDKGTLNPAGGAVGATASFVVPRGTYTLGSTIGDKTTFMGYSNETANNPVNTFTGFAVTAGQTTPKASFKIYVVGENATFAAIPNQSHELYFAYNTGITAARPVSVNFTNNGNTSITVTGFNVYKNGSSTALTSLASEPVTFTAPTLGTVNVGGSLTYTITPKAGQTNDTDATYRIEAVGTTPAHTDVTHSFNYSFKVNPVEVVSASISGTPTKDTALSSSYMVRPITQANAANNNTDQSLVVGALNPTGNDTRDVGYSWFRADSALSSPTFNVTAPTTLVGATHIGSSSTYTMTAADDGKIIYLVVYGKSTSDTAAANAEDYAITQIAAYYTGEITVELDDNKVTTAADAARYKVQLREGANTIDTTFNATKGVYETNTQLDTTKTYTIWATRSTKEVGTPNWINAGKTITNTKRSETIDYYTTDYEPNATVTNRDATITTETTLTGPIAGAVSAEIKGTAVALDPTDAVLSGTQVTFKYDKTAADATTGTARHWSDTTIQPHYKMTWGGSAATPAAAYGAVADKDLTVTEKITKVTASLGQETYTITFEVRGNGGTVVNPTLTVATGKGSGNRVATGTFNTTTNKTVTFSNMPAGDYTLTSTAGSETVIVNYVYGPESSGKTTTQIKDSDPAVTSAPVPVTKTSSGNQINIEASTYIVGWYEKGTAADWSDKKADTSENLGLFVYGYAAPAEIERRLYNVGNTDIPALKITSGSPNAVVTYTDKGGADVTAAVTTGAGVTLPVGDYIVAKITTATGKNANTTAYSSTLTASSSKTLTPDTGNSLTFTPSYTVGVATIDAYDLSTIAAPVNGTALDTVTGKTQAAKLTGESALRDQTGTAAIINVGTTTLTWAPTTTPAAAGTVYTVTVVANAINNNYVFDTTLTGYTLNGAAPTSRALSNNNRTLTLTYTFPATAPTVVAVTATATGGYTATGTITANATSTVNQEMFWVVVPNGATAPTAAEIINAATAGTWVDYGSGDAIYAGGEWGLRGFDIDGGLQPGTDYTIYATSRNKANTDAVGNVAHADFKTWYRVEVVTNPTSGAGTITAPAVATTPAGDNGKHVVYVADGSSTNLSASVNTGVTYVFGSWTETAPVGQTGAVAIGTSMTNQSFTPTKNTTVYANFTARPALEVTSRPGTTGAPSGYDAATINVVSADAKVKNIGTGATSGNVMARVVATGTAWNTTTLVAESNLFTVSSYTPEVFDPNEEHGFAVNPKAGLAAGTTYTAQIFFYDANDLTVYASTNVSFTVAATTDPLLTPPTYEYDVYKDATNAKWNINMLQNNFTVATDALPGEDGNVGIVHTTYTSAGATSNPNVQLLPPTNADGEYNLTTKDANNYNLEFWDYVQKLAATAKAGDRAEFVVYMRHTAPGNTTTAKTTLTLTFKDTTPHITAASIDQASAVTGTLLKATAAHPTTYNPTTANNVRYQWYRTDSATVTESWTKYNIVHEDAAVWEWTGATAITGATTANYTATADDAGHYLYVVAVGDADGDYVRDGAVSATVYVRPTVTVVIDGQGDGYGRVQIGTNTANSTNKKNDPKTDTVAAGGTIDVTAAANSGYYFTGWKLNDGTTVVSTASPYTVTPTGDTTVHANFDRLPTLTADTRFDTSGTTNSVSFTYTKNDGSGHVEIIIGNNVVKVAGNISGSTFSGTLPTGVTFNGTTLTLTKDWIVANLPSSGNSTGIAYDVKINDLDKDPNKQGDPRNNPYDTAVKLTVATDSYTVTSFTDKQTDGKWNGRYIGTVKTGASAASVLDSGSGNSVASVQAGNTVTLVAAPRAGYAFKQWTVMEGDAPATTANAKGYFGAAGTLTSTSSTAIFTPTADVEVRAEFEPITFNITGTL